MSGFVVPSRFRGPAHSGNGGWTSGHLAGELGPGPDDAVRVVLRRPPPLDRQLDLAVVGATATVAQPSDGSVVLWAELLSAVDAFTAAPPSPVSWDEALAAAGSYGGLADHPFPTCFACGTGRAEEDGLRLAPGRLTGEPGRTAATWVPHASLADASIPEDDLRTTAEVTWAALDCPGGWAVDLAGRPMVLGTMTAQVARTPRIGVRHVVVGRVVWQDGRKAGTETALYEADDTDDGTSAVEPRPLARASGIWIAVDPASVRPRTVTSGTAD
jgi:hypothetical protein